MADNAVMVVLAALLLADPLLLPIGRAGTISIGPNEIVDTRTGRKVSLYEVVEDAARSKYVFVGESHTSQQHHDLQAAIIDRLAARNIPVVVGFEMFTRPVQGRLDPWSAGMWDEATFIERADWKGQWGFPYPLYKPIFDVVRTEKLPMVALNVPRDWVRAVGRGGWDALTAEQKADLPAWTPPHPRHREVFEAMIGGHPMSGDAAENMYKAQCLWDMGMADSAVKYMKSRNFGPRAVFVVVAGSGHVMYDTAIPYRVKEYAGNPRMTTVVCIDGNERRTVSRGIADYVFMGPEQEVASGKSGLAAASRR
jgi:uncharacterized iron-regulated protein